MKVKPVFNSIDDINIKDYFSYYGINDMHKFIDGARDDSEEYKERVKSRNEQFRKARNFIENNRDREAYVLVDPDLDGFCSSAIIVRDGLGFTEIQPIFHSKKQHGVDKEIMELIPENSFFIIPDASIDVNYIEQLDAKNITTLVIDHHLTRPGENDTNNEKHMYICNGEDAPQSGSMYCYQFVASYGEGHRSRKNLELGVLGNFGDVQAQNYYETRFFNKKVEKPTHELLRKMIKYYAETNNLWLYPDVVGWKLGPKINSVIRSKNTDLKKEIFWALVLEEFDETLIAACDKQHEYQKSIVKEIASELEYDTSHNVIVVKTEPISEIVGINGLIANRIQSLTNKPTLALTIDPITDEETGEILYIQFQGSIRSPADVMTKFNSLNIIEVQGHERAAGVKFYKNKNTTEYCKNIEELEEVIQQFYEATDAMDFGGDETEVMLSCGYKELTEDLFRYFSTNICVGTINNNVIPYWGEGIPRPTIHMKYKTRFEDIEFVTKFKSVIAIKVEGANCRYTIHKDYIGRANKINWGICFESGPPNKYGKRKLLQNEGPVEIEMIGTLARDEKNRYTYEVQEWEFHPYSESEAYDVF